MEKGFIKLFRSFLKWEWYDDINTKVLFLHLLLTVNWEEKKWHGIVVRRGEIITSIKNLSKQTKLSYKQVRTAISKLKSTGEIEVETTNKYSKIRITNYDNYQKNDTQTGTQTTRNMAHYNTDKYCDTEKVGQTKGEQMGSQVGTQRATTKEYKEYKNKRNIYTPKKKRPKIESHIYDFNELERNLSKANKK